jgi:hypothetical protein
MSHSAESRINSYWERAAIGLLAIVMSLTVWAFKEQGQRVENLEAKVIAMDKVKVDRGDLKELEERLNSKMDALKSDILARQDLLQASIISRLDVYFKQKP